MAPNLKYFAFAPQHHLLNVQVVRPKALDYQPPRQPVEDSDSYWEWKTEPTFVLSTDHIVSNLLQSSETISKPSALKEENDDYWAEHPQEEHQKVPTQEEQPISYWDEQVHELSESDSYWNTNSKVAPAHSDEPLNYWDEQVHEVSASDMYWNTDSKITRSLHSEPVNYWDERAHAQSDSDAYWNTESQIIPSLVQNTDVSQAFLDAYWEPKSHFLTEADRYWSWSSTTEQESC